MAAQPPTHPRTPHVAGHAARASHPVHAIAVPRWAVRLAAKHRRAAGKPARIGTSRRAARYTMPARDVRRLLRVSWRAFGYRGAPLRVRVARNYRQVVRESGRRPAVLQGYIGDVNDHHPAGGLLQFIAPTMRHWHVGARSDRFNPLDNLLAGVNAQAHGPHYILNGRSGWSPPYSRNPLRRHGVLGVTGVRHEPTRRRVRATPRSTPTAKAAARPTTRSTARTTTRPTARPTTVTPTGLLAGVRRAEHPSLYAIGEPDGGTAAR